MATASSPGRITVSPAAFLEKWWRAPQRISGTSTESRNRMDVITSPERSCIQPSLASLDKPLMWRKHAGSFGDLPGSRKGFLGAGLGHGGGLTWIAVKGSRSIVRPVDWTRVPNMTFCKRERRRRYECKRLWEKESDRGWHPELCTYESEFAKMHALYFYNLLAFPWEKGAFERFVDQLERKYFPDDHIDALVPQKDPVKTKKPRRKRGLKAAPGDPEADESLDGVEFLEEPAGFQAEPEASTSVEDTADDWQPVAEASDSSAYVESVWDDLPRARVSSCSVPGGVSPKPPVVKRGMQLPENWDGPMGTALLIDKPAGWTSFTVCAKLRKLLKIQKVGHAGTLDPMATGLLIVCVGKSTKFIESYQAMTKAYSGTMRIGETTPSYDADTLVSEKLPWEHVTDEDVQLVKDEFIGTIRQVPPLYSALKVEGERLYEKARRGETFQVPPRLISIDDLQIERDSDNRQDFHFRVICSKGTYIRSLCYDIGRALNTCAHLTALRRERIGDMSVDDAWQMSELGNNYAADFLGKPCKKTPSLDGMSLDEAWEFPELEKNMKKT